MKNTAYIQATGEAIYTQDIRSLQDVHHGAYALSTQAFAKFDFIDKDRILEKLQQKYPSVVDFITSTDVENNILDRGPKRHPSTFFFITIYLIHL